MEWAGVDSVGWNHEDARLAEYSAWLNQIYPEYSESLRALYFVLLWLCNLPYAGSSWNLTAHIYACSRSVCNQNCPDGQQFLFKSPYGFYGFDFFPKNCFRTWENNIKTSKICDTNTLKWQQNIIRCTKQQSVYINSSKERERELRWKPSERRRQRGG